MQTNAKLTQGILISKYRMFFFFGLLAPHYNFDDFGGRSHRIRAVLPASFVRCTLDRWYLLLPRSSPLSCCTLHRLFLFSSISLWKSTQWKAHYRLPALFTSTSSLHTKLSLQLWQPAPRQVFTLFQSDKSTRAKIFKFSSCKWITHIRSFRQMLIQTINSLCLAMLNIQLDFQRIPTKSVGKAIWGIPHSKICSKLF